MTAVRGDAELEANLMHSSPLLQDRYDDHKRVMTRAGPQVKENIATAKRYAGEAKRMLEKSDACVQRCNL